MGDPIMIDTPLGRVSGSIVVPTGAKPTGILLAHGAGAGREHPWMTAMQARLATVGFPTMAFNYLYTEEGRRAPDRLPKLLVVHAAVADYFASHVDSVILAGKSMGGRVGGHLIAEDSSVAAGVAFLGYPLVAMGKAEPRDTTHLTSVVVPQLFISGDRDRMGPTDLIKDVVQSVPNGRLVIVEGGDHSLNPLKSSGRTLEDSLDLAAEHIDSWWRESD